MPRIGTVTLNHATVVIEATTTVTAAGRSFLTVQAPGATLVGVGRVSAGIPVEGVACDTSPGAWLIVEPA
ncbi:hypothetical protein [Streptomyces sp. NPDC059757]|uniref:hypothetical protein n=1 Tax=unclassified Streptomyces TaxID=2593676 RepID=UPI00364E558A